MQKKRQKVTSASKDIEMREVASGPTSCISMTSDTNLQDEID